MVNLEHGSAGQGGKSLAFLCYPLICNGDPNSGHRYRLAPAFPAETRVYEPRKPYGGSDNSEPAGAARQTSAEDIFSRLDRLRAQAGGNSVEAQLERLQGIAALMQRRDQGPMPGEMLRVYAWEVEDAVKKIMKNSGARIQKSE